MVQTLRYRDILQKDAQAHLTRATLTSARPRALHDHDFFEVFWVQNGQVRHHLSQQAHYLHEGDIVFLAPGVQHALHGRGLHALVVSLCFHPDLIKRLAERHPGLNGQLFWSDDSPVVRHRGIRQLAALNHAAASLEQSRRDALAAEAFLLPLCADLTAHGLPDDIPLWLADACLAAKNPEVFSQGAAGLVAQTGKAHAHVSRMMRKYLGQTPSDYINRIRMEHAARVLTTDDSPVSDIAENCGIPNMSHFHKLFRATHGMTPLQYRQRFQRQIVQPS